MDISDTTNSIMSHFQPDYTPANRAVMHSFVHHANLYKGYRIFDHREGKGSFTHFTTLCDNVEDIQED